MLSRCIHYLLLVVFAASLAIPAVSLANHEGKWDLYHRFATPEDDLNEWCKANSGNCFSLYINGNVIYINKKGHRINKANGVDLYQRKQNLGSRLEIKDIAISFRDSADKWKAGILSVAWYLFISLALIEFVITFGRMAITGPELGEFVAELFRRIVIISFGALLLQNPLWFVDVIWGFQEVAAVASTGDKTKVASGADMINKSFLIIESIWGEMSYYGVLDIHINLMLILTGALVLWAFATAGGQMILVMCEMYVVTSIGLITLGLFSLEFTREYPMRFFGAIIGIGVKLMTLQLITALGFDLIEEWIALGPQGPMSYAVMAGGAMVFKELAVKLPDYMQSLLSGSPSSGMSAGGAVAGGMAVAAVGTGTAAKVASLAASAVTAPMGAASAVGSVSKLGKQTGQGFAGALGSTIAAGVGGVVAAKTSGGAMASLAEGLGSQDKAKIVSLHDEAQARNAEIMEPTDDPKTDAHTHALARNATIMEPTNDPKTDAHTHGLAANAEFDAKKLAASKKPTV